MVNCVINSAAEPLAYPKNLINSFSEPLSAPSAMFEGMEMDELTICYANLYGLTSSITAIILTPTNKLL